MRGFAIAALCITLTACITSGDQPVQQSSILSFDDAKRLVLAERSRLWKDPDSIRDAAIGVPHACVGGLSHVADMPNVCVCVELNARNSLGGYTGLKRTEVLIRDTRVVDVITPAREMTYPCGAMTPFPEMNGGSTPPTPRRPS